MKRLVPALVILALSVVSAVAAPAPVTPAEARAIAREAYIYGFPMVDNYRIQYSYFVDGGSPEFKAPWNRIRNTPRVYTPADTAVQTPNSDTPYSQAGLDLRAEPVVLSLPPIEKERWYHVQLIDAYTHNFAYIGTRTVGNGGGRFLIAGPRWNGTPPPGITKVVRSETDFVLAWYRTQLFNPADIENVKRIQDGYKVEPLSTFTGTPAPKAQPIEFIAPLTVQQQRTDPEFFRVMNFVFNACPPHPSEKELLARFGRLGIGPGGTFDPAALTPELRAAVEQGMADAWQEYEAFRAGNIDTGKVLSGDVLGSRESLKNNYLYRMTGAQLGIYGNSKEEAIYPVYFADANGAPLDASKHAYALRFAPGQLPPVNAFWSLTLYEMPTSLLYANDLDRYLINSTMLPALERDTDGGLTLYITHQSPGPAKASNWLPAPNGQFRLFLRLYSPQPEAVDGRWQKPPLQVLPLGAEPRPVTQGVLESRIGPIEFELGFPSKAAVSKLYDELDFQRASQAYIWGLPIVGFAEWQHSAATSFGAGELDYVVYESPRDKVGILTPNGTTPYTIAFSDLSKTGPLVVEVPPGASAGGVLDFWQRPTTDTGLAGPDRGTGAKYLVLPPGSPDVQAPGHRVVRSPTFNIFVGHRALDPDPAKAQAWVRSLRLYPYAQRDNPPATRFLTPEGRAWSQVPPRGLDYWKRLADILQREPVEERDRFFMAMLAPLGIEKGKPFAPDARQKTLLEQAAFVGEAMAMAISFDKRTPGAPYREDSNWQYVIMFDPSQESKYYSQLDERTDYFYEAVTTTSGMTTRTPGVGQAYLGAYELKDGERFDGGTTYRLRVPPNAPAKQFWSLTVYDVDTRSFAVTKEMIVDRSSRGDLVENADGSIDLYMGPKPPKGYEKNWIPTVPGRGFFVLFRLYAPTEAYFDRSWPLPPIERVP